MAKQQLNERFQELAGIKPLATLKEDKIKEQMMHNMETNPIMKEELFTALAGLAGVIGMAGVTGQIQAAMEDPAIAEKYPALAKIFGFLSKMGGDLGKGIK
tara:strand:- start:49 stop:351 length:303 start_codon:yes stop_codon:yes gene_type:complete